MFVQYLFGGPEGISPARGDKLRLPQAHGKMKTALSDGFHFGGPEGIRTLDLSDANRTLSQLSYGPMCLTRELRALNCVWDVARVTTA